MSAAVPAEVLAAFGIEGECRPLTSGQGTSFAAGSLVLKPEGEPHEVAWLAELLARHPTSAVRLAAPAGAVDGRYVVCGWSATVFLEGAPVRDDDTSPGPWLKVLEAGRCFHQLVRDEPRPGFLERRTHRWAVADRVAWGESRDLPLPDRASGLVHDTAALVVDEGLPDQLVHGDLSGNVLQSDCAVPAIIDVSPYWRPAAYADAVVVVDALLWWRTDGALVDLARPTGLDPTSWRSLLARALVFRLLAFDPTGRTDPEVDAELQRYGELVELIERA